MSKPIVAASCARALQGGLSHLKYAEHYPEKLRVIKEIREIDTTWIAYGTRKRFRGELIGILSPELFQTPASA